MRARTNANANKNLLTFSGELHDVVMTLKLRHPFAPPANGTGPAIRLPQFTRLTSLVIEDSMQSLVGRMDIVLKTSNASACGNTGIAGKKARRQLSSNQAGQQGLDVLVSPQRRNNLLLDRCLSRVYWIGKRRHTCVRTHGRDNSASGSPTTDPATTTTTDPSGPPPPSLGPPPSRPPPRPHPPHRLHPLSPPVAPMQDSIRHASLPDTAEKEEVEPAGPDDAGPAPSGDDQRAGQF